MLPACGRPAPPDVLLVTFDTTRWKSAEGVLNQLGVPAGIQTAVTTLFGSKLKVKGQGGPTP